MTCCFPAGFFAENGRFRSRRGFPIGTASRGLKPFPHTISSCNWRGCPVGKSCRLVLFVWTFLAFPERAPPRARQQPGMAISSSLCASLTFHSIPRFTHPKVLRFPATFNLPTSWSNGPNLPTPKDCMPGTGQLLWSSLASPLINPRPSRPCFLEYWTNN